MGYFKSENGSIKNVNESMVKNFQHALASAIIIAHTKLQSDKTLLNEPIHHGTGGQFSD